MEEEEANILESALGVEVDGECMGEEEGEGILRSLGAIEFMTQDSEPSRTMLIDSCNRFNKLIPLEMLWTVRHHWQAGARFAFNFYKHWAQLLLRQTGELPVTILSREGVTQGDPFLWFYTGSPSSPWQRSFEQRIRGSSPLSTRMMQLSMLWHDKAHSS